MQFPLVLAHALYPEFPSLAVLLLIVLAVGSLIAVAAWKWRPGLPTAESSSRLWRVPVVAFVACAIAVPVSFMPGLDLLGSVVLMPGFMLCWPLGFQGLIPDNVGWSTAIMVIGGFSWGFWTMAGLIISKIAGRFRRGNA